MTSEIITVVVIIIGLAVTALGIITPVSKIRKNAICAEEAMVELLHYEKQYARTSRDSSVNSVSTYYQVWKTLSCK